MLEVTSQDVISIQEGRKGISEPAKTPFLHNSGYEASWCCQTHTNLLHKNLKEDVNAEVVIGCLV